VIPPLAALVVGILFLGFLTRFSPESSAPVYLPESSGSVSFNGIGTTPNLSPIFSPEIQHWGTQIVHWAAEYNIDPNLVATVMQIESCGNPDARSSAGAMGLFQVMPFHFYALDNPYNPDTNARRGLAYLKRSLVAAGGNPDLALAGYNGGISVISKSRNDWAAETQRYLYWGSGIYADASSGASESSRLSEWLSHGGGMCKRARDKLGLP
jgi:hypothetical protein